MNKINFVALHNHINFDIPPFLIEQIFLKKRKFFFKEIIKDYKQVCRNKMIMNMSSTHAQRHAGIEQALVDKDTQEKNE
jgi:hypothetical protein